MSKKTIALAVLITVGYFVFWICLAMFAGTILSYEEDKNESIQTIEDHKTGPINVKGQVSVKIEE